MDLSRYQAADFDRGAPVWKEALWRLCQGFFFQALWPVPSSWRVGLLRWFGARIGARAVIRAGVNISFPWRLEMGDDVWIGEEVMILSLAPVRLGSNVCLSQRSFLCTGWHDRHRETFDLVVKPITIHSGCWVAAAAFVGPGVDMPSGTVLAAGAVLVKSPEKPGMYAGNPARAIGV
ncbi:MAG: WcaF family extracellular polysaccharide biosynthesis acetyltransferase [Candidatus Methylacidiphilales bacterium]|nr:WcaF family extracellular polysaccharide biosynthesis acetyltransferase [Candidatus Methylacidiphilales bacterium]